ncbi:MAG: hypothetical protein M3297_05650 [Thermoproteota archaeon]|nr:hypothetical protein [Thermoproteota archaeon]
MKVAIMIILSTFILGLSVATHIPAAAQGSSNITTPVAPQGTSLEVTGDNLTDEEQETSAGNISEPIVPG